MQAAHLLDLSPRTFAATCASRATRPRPRCWRTPCFSSLQARVLLRWLVRGFLDRLRRSMSPTSYPFLIIKVCRPHAQGPPDACMPMGMAVRLKTCHGRLSVRYAVFLVEDDDVPYVT